MACAVGSLGPSIPECVFSQLLPFSCAIGPSSRVLTRFAGTLPGGAVLVQPIRVVASLVDALGVEIVRIENLGARMLQANSAQGSLVPPAHNLRIAAGQLTHAARWDMTHKHTRRIGSLKGFGATSSRGSSYLMQRSPQANGEGAKSPTRAPQRAK